MGIFVWVKTRDMYTSWKNIRNHGTVGLPIFETTHGEYVSKRRSHEHVWQRLVPDAEGAVLGSCVFPQFVGPEGISRKAARISFSMPCGWPSRDDLKSEATDRTSIRPKGHVPYTPLSSALLCTQEVHAREHILWAVVLPGGDRVRLGSRRGLWPSLSGCASTTRNTIQNNGWSWESCFSPQLNHHKKTQVSLTKLQYPSIPNKCSIPAFSNKPAVKIQDNHTLIVRTWRQKL